MAVSQEDMMELYCCVLQPGMDKLSDDFTLILFQVLQLHVVHGKFTIYIRVIFDENKINFLCFFKFYFNHINLTISCKKQKTKKIDIHNN